MQPASLAPPNPWGRQSWLARLQLRQGRHWGGGSQRRGAPSEDRITRRLAGSERYGESLGPASRSSRVAPTCSSTDKRLVVLPQRYPAYPPLLAGRKRQRGRLPCLLDNGSWACRMTGHGARAAGRGPDRQSRETDMHVYVRVHGHGLGLAWLSRAWLVWSRRVESSRAWFG